VVQLDSNLPRVKIDRGKIEQVFINLFINAVQAMSSGGVLTITARQATGPRLYPQRNR
jgi:signal transduction histidine kinase